MNRATFHRISAVLPFACSLLAAALIAVVSATGWERHVRDEGAAAHLFQLLMALQVPLIALFVATGPRGSAGTLRRTVLGQCAAMCVPLGLAAAAGL